MKRLRSIIEGLEDWVSGLLIVGGLFVLFYGVVLRYVLDLPTTWQDEIARYLIIWGTLIGASVALRDNSHIRVEMLYQMFPKKSQHWINIFANIVSMAFFIFLIVYGIELVQQKFATGQTSTGGVPLWFIYIILPLSGLMLTVRITERLVRLFQGKPESELEESVVTNQRGNES